MSRRFLRHCLLALCAFLIHGYCAAASFPDRPVRFIVPFPPGGGTDTLARILGTELAKTWNQQVVVDNRSGAQGNIGTALAARAPADGYTLVLAHQGVFTVNPHMYTSIGFDPIKDLLPVAQVTEQPFAMVINPGLPANSMKELTDLAKREPGRLTFASSASGPQMAGEMYKMVSGANLLHVPYKGAAPAVVDLLAGHVNIMFSNPVSVAPHVKAGKLRALGVFGVRRSNILPDVPTAAEAGYPQLGETPEWYGIAVPAGTPANIVAQLAMDAVAALNNPEVQKAVRAQGLEPAPGNPDQFARKIRLEFEQWGKVVRASGVKAE